METLHGVQPQLYADNLKCVSCNDIDLLESARFTNKYIRLVGQSPAPSKCVLLSTSTKVVRGHMKDWVLSDNGDKWSVKLDVRDLGGHLDTTMRHRASTLSGRVSGLLNVVLVVMALPLVFSGKLRILRTKFFTWCATCCIGFWHFFFFFFTSEAEDSFCILTLLDGPPGCDPGFNIVWCRFRLFRRYLAYRPGEVPRLFNLIGLVAAGGPGFGPIHLLVDSALVLGFTLGSLMVGMGTAWLALLHQLAGPYQHYKSPIWDA